MSTMNNDTQRFVAVMIVFVLFVATYVAVMRDNIVQHEKAHEQIMKFFNCEEVVITYGFLSGQTRCVVRNDAYSAATQLREYELHAINEIVGYNLTGVITTIFVVGLFVCEAIVFLFFELNNKKR